MKKTLFPLLLCAVTVSTANAQDLYALTGKSVPNIVFNDIRAIDSNSAVQPKIIFTAESKAEVYSDVRRMTVSEDISSFNHAQAAGMASLAYLGNELVYMPMHSTNIYALNITTKKITLIKSSAAKTVACDIHSHFTRMTTGADGSVYAMTNSGSQLLKISKQKGVFSVLDLGEVKDHYSNGQNSIKIMLAGFGGDIIADASGDLYIFAASGNVFKMNPKNLTAVFVGKINGLPQDFTLNGAAVSADGNIYVASAKGQGLYQVDIDNLQAKSVENSEKIPVYDLASRYLAHDKKQVVAVANSELYPTLVNLDFINLKLADEHNKGTLTVEVFNSGGITALKQSLQAKSRESERKIELGKLPTGMYLVILKDENGKQILTKKIIVE